jgi:hypothetical protein
MVVDAGLDTAGRDADGWESAREASNGAAGDGSGKSRARTLAQDWITLWQSELSAIAADPEIRESWQTMMSLWAGTMAAAVRAMPRPRDDAPYDNTGRRTAPADATRATPTAAAPDPRDAEIERLARHVAALERRLADIERGDNPPVHPKRRPRRKP